MSISLNALQLREPNQHLIKNVLNHLAAKLPSGRTIEALPTGLVKHRGPVITNADAVALRIQGQILKILGVPEREIKSMLAENTSSLIAKLLRISKLEAHAIVLASIADRDDLAMEFMNGAINPNTINVNNYSALLALFRWIDSVTPEDTLSYPKVFNNSSEVRNYLNDIIKNKVLESGMSADILKLISNAVLEVSFGATWSQHFLTLLDVAIAEIVVWPFNDKCVSRLGPIFKVIEPSLKSMKDFRPSPSKYAFAPKYSDPLAEAIEQLKKFAIPPPNQTNTTKVTF